MRFIISLFHILSISCIYILLFLLLIHFLFSPTLLNFRYGNLDNLIHSFRFSYFFLKLIFTMKMLDCKCVLFVYFCIVKTFIFNNFWFKKTPYFFYLVFCCCFMCCCWLHFFPRYLRLLMFKRKKKKEVNEISTWFRIYFE